jgi:hypothetical protein
VVGQGKGVVAQLERGGDELIGLRGPIEERERGVAVKFDV